MTLCACSYLSNSCCARPKQTRLLFSNPLSSTVTTGVQPDMFTLLPCNALTPQSHHHDITLKTHPKSCIETLDAKYLA